ncbi:hypothetical protein O181_066709 [Austropuccinia psidii MF-1]|uniref:Uncharacterized protein n=1 Tax=Austropuccinia psidii MF-1 TaxID=1389203 RepID=A0A9Q3ETI3_9BASI|nr:hypothetical protein [Austropuccinia psidii MF-1]
MVHTRNGSNYSVQSDGCGKGRAKNKSRSVKSSSRKTHLEDSRVAPHLPRSVPTNFDLNSESELIYDNILRAEPLSSGSNRNLSMPIQTFVQRSQRRGVGNMCKPLAGDHELRLTHQELSGSGEDHKTFRRLEPIFLQRQGQEDNELVEKPKYFIHSPEEGTGYDSIFGDRGPSSIYQLQRCPKTSAKDLRRNREVPRTIKAREKAKPIGTDLTHKGTGFPNWSLQTWTLDAKLIKITLNINDLKKNDKQSAEMHKSVITTLELLTNTCDRIESKYQVQNDEIEDFSILNINDQLKILKDHVLGITKNTNQFATHLAKSDSEKQKLKNEIISNVEQIHKNYEPHMPRYSKPFTEENLSVKETLTPFLGENVFSEKDIPKLEEWPTFSGEVEYNHIEFIRTIDMLQENLHIPYEIVVGKLHSLFTRTSNKWYYKMRIDHGKHDWSWWKSGMITKWGSNSWRFKMENSFESAIFN